MGMSFTVDDYEKLGAFYLGKEYDLKKKSVEEDLVRTLFVSP